MTSGEARGAVAHTPLLIRFPDAAAANRRLAGMSAAGRWVARAREAGWDAVAIELAVGGGDAGDLAPATRADFRRADIRGGVPVVDPATRPAGARVVDGRFLPGAQGLARGDATDAIDLDQPGLAVRRILLATAKPSDGVISRWINRPISQRISAALLLLLPGIRPWHMTLSVAAVAIVMVGALLAGGAPGLIWGGILFQVASVLDGVDGEIARATYRSSPAGAALDTRVDMLTNIGYFVGIAVALTRLYGGAQAAVGGLAVVFALTGLGILAWLIRRLGGSGSFDVLKLYYRRRFPGGWQWLVTETLVAMTSRDFFAFAFGVVIVCGAGWAVSWLLMGFTATWLVAVLCAVPGVLREASPQVKRVRVRGI